MYQQNQTTMSKSIIPFNVIVQDINNKSFEPYDVMPYFLRVWKEKKQNRPTSFEELKKWIKSESMYMFWSRCEWEVIIGGWPNTETQEKWDVHKQIMMNFDLFVRIFAENVNFIGKLK